MTEWNVALTVVSPANTVDQVVIPDESVVDEILGHLADYAPVASWSPDRLTVRLWVANEVPTYAMEEASRLVRKACVEAMPALDSWMMARAEIMSEAEIDASLEEPTYPTVVGIAELADLLAVSRQRASQVARTAAFPTPYAELASGPIWLYPNVQQFIETWDRKPGRPRKQVAEL